MRFRVFYVSSVILAAFALVGCGERKDGSNASARMLVCSGLPPVAYLASAVGGERVESRSLLPEGRSPHDYSPGAREIRWASSSRLFFTTGMSFENTVSRPLDPARTRVVDVSAGVKRIPFDGEEPMHHHEETAVSDTGYAPRQNSGEIHPDDHTAAETLHDGHAEEHEHDAFDPHVWLSADNAAMIAENIASSLKAVDPEGASLYDANLAALKRELADSGAYARKELAPYAGRAFFVYHPAFGYFAEMTGLKQIAIELGGRETTSGRLAEIVKKARELGVRVVFVQPQFNPASARALGEAIGGRVVGLDALAADIPGNIRAMTDALKAGFVAEKEE